MLSTFKGEYMTIHITPEPEFSYVSFESNIPLTSYLGVIQRVLETFLPGKFILTVFANRVSSLLHNIRSLLYMVYIFRLPWQPNLTRNFKNVAGSVIGLVRISSTANFKIMS